MLVRFQVSTKNPTTVDMYAAEFDKYNENLCTTRLVTSYRLDMDSIK